MSSLGELNTELDKLRSIIRKKIMDCDEVAYPNICRGAAINRQHVENVILEYCLEHSIGVNTAMNMVEVEGLV